jgi:hypothetical protein
MIGPLAFAPAPRGTVRLPAGRGLSVVYLHLMLVLAIAFAMPAVLLAALNGIAVQMQ